MLKVIVSPFLGISEWVDPHSGLTFSKSAGIIEIPVGADLTGIRKHIRLNQLIIVGGSIDQTASVPAQEPQAEAPQEEPKVETMQVEEPVVENIPEAAEIPLEEMSYTELKALAKDLGIQGYSTMKKQVLIDSIKEVK